MLIKPEHKKAAAAILHEIANKAGEIHRNEFKSKYKKGDEEEPAPDADDDLSLPDGDALHDEEHGGDEVDDEAPDEGEEGDEEETHGHPDLLMLRKLAKKHK